MSKRVVFYSVVVSALVLAFAGIVEQESFRKEAVAASANLTVARQQLAGMPLAFVHNNGQWDDRVLFRTSAGGATIWFCRDGITYQFTHRIPCEDADPDDPIGAFRARFPNLSGSEAGSSTETRLSAKDDGIEVVVVKAEFESPDPSVEVTGTDMLDYKCNYFHGNDPSRWRTDVPSFEGIVYRDIYPGIDARFESENGQLRVRWDAKPGADLSQIQFRYESNVEVTEDESGALSFEAPWGTIVNLSSFPSRGAASLGFTSSGAATGLQTSTIGVMLDYSTYLGGDYYDYAYGIAVDANGSAYVTGLTWSEDFPTQNPYADSIAMDFDTFVTKFAADGSSLVYSTFLGGNSSDQAYGVALDPSNSAYVAGLTLLSRLPSPEWAGQHIQWRWRLLCGQAIGGGKRPAVQHLLGRKWL